VLGFLFELPPLSTTISSTTIATATTPPIRIRPPRREVGVPGTLGPPPPGGGAASDAAGSAPKGGAAADRGSRRAADSSAPSGSACPWYSPAPGWEASSAASDSG